MGTQAPIVPNAGLPPMLTSYLEYKSKYPDCLLLCQVGDFYEIFFADAVTVSKTLNLTLTSRDKNSPNPIPMCGVPIGVVDGYLNRLVAAGFSVAVVSQRGTAEGVKGMVPRYLERIVTPGVQVLGEGISGNESRVGALVSHRGSFALAFTNVTSGVILVRDELSRDELIADINRAGLNEIIVPALIDDVKMDRRIGWVRTLVALVGERGVKFRSQSGSAAPQAAIVELSGAASVGAHGKRAAALLIEYVSETTAQRSAPFERLQVYSWEEQLALDAATRRTLELVTNATDGSERNTLFSVMNNTRSPGGARLLKRWLLAPSRNIDEISGRQTRTGKFVADEAKLARIQERLSTVADVERIATRVALKAVTPREIAALRDSLLSAKVISNELEMDPAFTELSAICARGMDLGRHLERWVVSEPAVSIGEGGDVIASGLDATLDKARALVKDGHGMLVALEAKQRQATKISTLKIKFNNQLGYFFEVTKSQAEKLSSEFQRRQSTVSGERFFNQELKALEQDLFSASSKARTRELELFAELVATIEPRVAELREIGRSLSEVDVYSCFAELARERGWIKPEISPNSTELVIEGGRHPVLERILAEKFIPNGLKLDNSRLALLVTGPNMGGKSTYLRQVAQLTILAQIGSFVPASRMRAGLVDGVYARLGASDNLAEGDSTFMVEMREAALICAAASPQSLVVIDEIGRGTATADGRALAQSILEWLLVQIKCRVLFATHFHELTDLSKLYSQLGNVSVGSIERDGVVHFTHEIVEGPANRSYGIEVASHAGLPAALLNRARQLMETEVLEREVPVSPSAAPPRQLSIFEATGNLFGDPSGNPFGSAFGNPTGPIGHRSATGAAVNSSHAKVIERLQALAISDTTPIQALTALDELQRMLHD